jgi:hypothetical protein
MRRLGVFTTLTGYGLLLIALRPHWADQGFWTYWGQDPERALVDVAALAGWALAAWLFVATALAAAAQAPSAAGRMASRAARIVTPRAARRLLEAALGVALAVGPAGAALAGPADSAPVRAGIELVLAPVPAPIVAAPEATFPDLDRPLLPAPTTPAARVAATPTPSSMPSSAPSSVPTFTPASPPASGQALTPAPAARHTVVPGDTLWGVAAAAAPPGASPAAITKLWQQWYAANRTTIGADPNLLLPGQALAAPVAS